MMNLEGTDPDKFDVAKMDVADKWILSRLAATVADVTELIEEFKYNEPLNAIYKFFWNDFCDWYLEWSKPRMQDEAAKPTAQNVLAFVLDQTLRLLHPFVPFITEGIFQKLNELAPVRKLNGLADAGQSDALIVAKWPEGLDSLVDPDIEEHISIVQSVIRSIREVRNQYNIPPSKKLVASAASPGATAAILNDNSHLIRNLAALDNFEAAENMQKPESAAAAIVEEIQVFVHDVIDKDAERLRLDKQKAQIENGLRGVEGKLNNENFISRAKPEVVAQAREKQKELNEQLQAIENHIAQLG
jgi:valyl-tRNA synthetase